MTLERLAAMSNRPRQFDERVQWWQRRLDDIERFELDEADRQLEIREEAVGGGDYEDIVDAHNLLYEGLSRLQSIGRELIRLRNQLSDL